MTRPFPRSSACCLSWTPEQNCFESFIWICLHFIWWRKWTETILRVSWEQNLQVSEVVGYRMRWCMVLKIISGLLRTDYWNIRASRNRVSIKLIWKQKVTRIRINWELNVENYLNLDLVWVFQSQWKQSVVRFFTRHKSTEEYLYLELEWIIRKYEMKYSELVRLRQSNYRNLLQPNKSFNSIYCTFKYWLIHHVTIVGWITDGWGKVSIQKLTIVFDDCK